VNPEDLSDKFVDKVGSVSYLTCIAFQVFELYRRVAFALEVKMRSLIFVDNNEAFQIGLRVSNTTEWFIPPVTFN